MKIKRLNINSFRGIPNECELSFVDKQGEAISTIIYGTNGSGKSSIVDAIEYCLQGRIERSKELDNALRPSTLNLASNKLKKPSIEITFEDNSTSNRSIYVELDKDSLSYHIINNDEEMNPSFNICPIVLRRNDIISYNMTEEERRQTLMLQFMYDVDIENKLDNDPEIRKKHNLQVIEKNNRRNIIQRITKLIKIDGDLLEKSKNVEETIGQYFTPKGQRFAFSRSTLEPKKNLEPSIYNKVINFAKICDNHKRKINSLDKIIKDLKSLKQPEKYKELEPIFKEASKYLTSAFKEISNAKYVEDIELSIGSISITSLNIIVKLSNGKKVSPNHIFSEANYDLMILLLYLSLIRVGADKGQEKVLILDDVLQSVDSNIRANFIIYILKELKDWQLFITCHDRLWLNQLKYLFNNASHKFKEYQISNWSFSNGPVLKEGNNLTYDDTLQQAIKTGNIRIMASMSGLFLEKICQELSVSLNCSIERKREDKYTIGDLWPSIKKSLKRTNIFSLIEKIDKSLCIRNLLGCHYNKWAESFSDEEVREFASNIQELYEKTFCPKCNTWIEKSRSKDIKYECKCRNIQY